MSRLLCVLLATVLWTSPSSGVEHSDLEMLGVSCPRRDSCLSPTAGQHFDDRNCECGRDCGFFDDCCVDAPTSTAARRGRNTRLVCMQYSNDSYRGEYVVGTCPTDYSGPRDMLRRCRDASDNSDPLLSAPVTDTATRITYRNRFCAECNDADASQLQSWLIYLDCGAMNAAQGVDDATRWRNLAYHRDVGLWGIRNGRQFHVCRLWHDKPRHVSSTLRRCRPNLISTCPRNWDRPAVSRACGAYTAVVYSRDSDTSVAYRNPHCAICHGLAVDDVTCDPVFLMSRRNKPFSFAMLLDVNRSDGDLVGVSKQSCPGEQKWDPFFKKCRQLSCALPGYKVENGRCVKPNRR